ncbi:MAG TPA: WbqC family protein [Burkholderiaceae bacterium]|jgi:hypothetical protein
MNVGIHQPQYLPWLPYFLKIEQSDVFLLLDTVDFQKNGLQNRNQIKTAQGAHWLTVPVRQQLGQKIIDVKIDDSTTWRRKHWQSIQQCYAKAPAFKDYEKDLEAIYLREWIGLCDLSVELTVMMMRWMNIQTPLLRSSQMKATGTASDLVLNLCLETGANRYLSGTGGANYLKAETFRDAGVEIVYQAPVLPEGYPQLFPQAGFINHLSALDILLNCGSSWRNYLPAEIVAI